MRKHPVMLNDIIFKIVFGGQGSEALLGALLNALLCLQGTERIGTLELLNPQIEKRSLVDKGLILDLLARDGAGKMYNVEVQLVPRVAYIDRTVFYLCRSFGQQLKPGDEYGELRRTISVSLVDFKLFPDVPTLHNVTRLYSVEMQRVTCPLLEWHYIELPKFQKERPSALRTPSDRWLHVLKYGERYAEGTQPLSTSLQVEDGISMAIEKLRNALADEQVRQMMREKAEIDYYDELARARREGREQGREQGLEQGREQGLEQGLEQGREQGLEQGREQGLEQGREEGHLEVARKMRDEGFDDETIHRLTGVRLSLEN